MHFNIYSDAPENERTKEIENNIFGNSNGGGGGGSRDDFFI